MCEVSVIGAFYKVEPYIRECVESALTQTFGDYELILVDDGSPDACGAILDEYARGDARVRVIHKENGGLASARNAGLDVARGRFVYFLDGDDVMMPELLERAVAEMRDGIDMVCFDHVSLPLEHPEWHGLSIEAPCEHEPKTGQALLEFLCQKYLTGELRFEVWNRMYRRDVIERFGLRFVDTKRVLAEDMCFNLMYLAHANHLRTIPDQLYGYRNREGSIMRGEQGKTNLDRWINLGFEVLAHYRAHDDCAYLANRFSPLFYMVVHRELFKMVRTMVLHGGSYDALREEVRASTTRFDEFQRMVLDGLADKQALGDELRVFGRVRELCERASVPLIVMDETLAIRVQSALLHAAGVVARPLFKAYLRRIGARM